MLDRAAARDERLAAEAAGDDRIRRCCLSPRWSVRCMLSSAIVMFLNLGCVITLSERGVNSLVVPFVLVLSGNIVPLPFFPNWLQPILFRATFCRPGRYPISDLLRRVSPEGSRWRASRRCLHGRLCSVLVRASIAARGDEPPAGAGWIDDERVSALPPLYRGVDSRRRCNIPASFLMMAMGEFIVTFTEFVGVWVLFRRFGQIRGWTFRRDRDVLWNHQRQLCDRRQRSRAASTCSARCSSRPATSTVCWCVHAQQYFSYLATS